MSSSKKNRATSNQIADRINKIAARSKQRKKASPSKNSTTGEEEQNLILPSWPEWERAIPNEIVRSALFNIGNRRERREYHEDVPIVVLGDGEIIYRGQELRQDDQDVWLYVLQLARHQPLGEWVEFSAYSFCKSLGWSTSGQSYKRLMTCLSRMQATALKIRNKRLNKGISLSLIRMFDYEDDQGNRLDRWRVWVEPKMRQLFGNVHYTRLEWKQRRQLKPLAKWLQGYFASHKQPKPVSVASLHQGCGSEQKQLRFFRPKLKSALDEMKAIGFLEVWCLDDKDRIHVVRAKK
ncbi:plasmid replication initiator TrfA [Nitrosococcus watsonii]|uniref:TrfA family protein n=1 Tax=Nitrosococcus watsoni (strain C-113) TaxID=105559 RepID=D8KCD0_NITWC|nr:plasmid replication initiator TrfA [Nitrosococcus watsonii]ADJ29871.1 TrfA family protein [Nitrosococcus watsonii C-113]